MRTVVNAYRSNAYRSKKQKMKSNDILIKYFQLTAFLQQLSSHIMGASISGYFSLGSSILRIFTKSFLIRDFLFIFLFLGFNVVEFADKPGPPALIFRKLNLVRKI